MDYSSGDKRRLSRAERRNFAGGLWHGAFLALGMALTQPTTVLAAFIADLTGSTVWVGGLSTVLGVADALPKLFVARWLEPRPRKMPLLLLAIYLRVASWGVLALLIDTVSSSRPELLAWTLVGLLVIFYAGGGLGAVAYTDIVGKVIPPHRRGAFFGGKEALAGPLAVAAALAARHILATVAYPGGYALLFALAAAGLAIASIGFWIIREPASSGGAQRPRPWHEYRSQVLATTRRLGPLVMVQWLTGFSLMALPFYVVYARDRLSAPPEAIGWFLLAQVAGGVIANLLWSRLVDRAGSREMLTWCAVTSAATPTAAVVLGGLGWQALLPVFFLAGAAFNGRKVGLDSALLELAPVAERPTYAGVNTVLALPIAFLPLLAGALLHYWSYPQLFSVTAGFIALGAAWTRRLPARETAKSS